MRKFRGIVQTNIEPQDHEILWYNKGELLFFNNGEWQPFLDINKLLKGIEICCNCNNKEDDMTREEIIELIREAFIVQDKGDNTDVVMSQKAVTDAINDIKKDIVDSTPSTNDDPIISKTLFLNINENIDNLQNEISYERCTGSFIDVWNKGDFNILAHKVVLKFMGGECIELNNVQYKNNSLYATAVYIPYIQEDTLDNCRFLIAHFTKDKLKNTISQVTTTQVQ